MLLIPNGVAISERARLALQRVGSLLSRNIVLDALCGSEQYHASKELTA
jgi:hypothetical protein